jgi:hypothetical protein
MVSMHDLTWTLGAPQYAMLVLIGLLLFISAFISLTFALGGVEAKQRFYSKQDPSYNFKYAVLTAVVYIGILACAGMFSKLPGNVALGCILMNILIRLCQYFVMDGKDNPAAAYTGFRDNAFDLASWLGFLFMAGFFTAEVPIVF